MKENIICKKNESLIFNIFLIFFIVMSICSTVNATEKAYSDDTYYLSMFYSGYNNVLVTNSAEENVTEWFVSRTVPLFQQNNITEIKRIIAEEQLTLHVFTETQNYALEQYKSVRSDMQYFILWDKNYAVSLEVTSELVGGIWYNTNTGAVTRTSTPTYTILSKQCNSSSIETYANNFQTGSNVVSGKGHFWGSCSFGGQAYVKAKDNPYEQIKLVYDFGSKRVSFNAVP